MKKKIYIILMIFIIVGGIIIMLNINKESKILEGKIKYISMDEIVQIMQENENYIILDVRTEAE